jgi:hypothetical protein
MSEHEPLHPQAITHDHDGPASNPGTRAGIPGGARRSEHGGCALMRIDPACYD